MFRVPIPSASLRCCKFCRKRECLGSGWSLRGCSMPAHCTWCIACSSGRLRIRILRKPGTEPDSSFHFQDCWVVQPPTRRGRRRGSSQPLRHRFLCKRQKKGPGSWPQSRRMEQNVRIPALTSATRTARAARRAVAVFIFVFVKKCPCKTDSHSPASFLYIYVSVEKPSTDLYFPSLV